MSVQSRDYFIRCIEMKRSFSLSYVYAAFLVILTVVCEIMHNFKMPLMLIVIENHILQFGIPDFNISCTL